MTRMTRMTRIQADFLHNRPSLGVAGLLSIRHSALFFCYTEFHREDTEFHRVILLCETLCLLCVTPCNNNHLLFNNFEMGS